MDDRTDHRQHTRSNLSAEDRSHLLDMYRAGDVDAALAWLDDPQTRVRAANFAGLSESEQARVDYLWARKQGYDERLVRALTRRFGAEPQPKPPPPRRKWVGLDEMRAESERWRLRG